MNEKNRINSKYIHGVVHQQWNGYNNHSESHLSLSIKTYGEKKTRTSKIIQVVKQVEKMNNRYYMKKKICMSSNVFEEASEHRSHPFIPS